MTGFWVIAVDYICALVALPSKLLKASYLAFLAPVSQRILAAS